VRRPAAGKARPGARTVRCAIYTRKSSEEGLEQEFNSLDAQREACAAFILSQKHEGWVVIEAPYDDGGVSGATMERSALRRLLADIAAGRVDTVVTYKVDRLTRSLADFAKIVEVFDANGVSFVSVTQQFNTTTSMGRLTLNVLLSFAQFEREVTGERIRNKIAASKRKGMWMGGPVPLGYDAIERKLVVNRAEAATVRHVFRRYAELGSVRLLKETLDAEGIVGKVRVSRTGQRTGGKPFARGALYRMLQNRIYLGETVHRDNSYPGEHEAIIDRDLWDRVQATLAENRVEPGNGGAASNPSLLAGLLHDDQGERMTPSHAVKNGRRYRYYLSRSLTTQNREAAPHGRRIPAGEIDRLVTDRLKTFLASEAEVFAAVQPQVRAGPAQRRLIAQAATLAREWKAQTPTETRKLLRAVVSRIDLRPDRVDMRLLPERLVAAMAGEPPGTGPAANAASAAAELTLTVPARLKRVGLEMKLLIEGPDGRQGIQIRTWSGWSSRPRRSSSSYLRAAIAWAISRPARG
jgi:DNA invertase Pin-like site-specific DNA recombinase